MVIGALWVLYHDQAAGVINQQTAHAVAIANAVTPPSDDVPPINRKTKIPSPPPPPQQPHQPQTTPTQLPLPGFEPSETEGDPDGVDCADVAIQYAAGLLCAAKRALEEQNNTGCPGICIATGTIMGGVSVADWKAFIGHRTHSEQQQHGWMMELVKWASAGDEMRIDFISYKEPCRGCRRGIPVWTQMIRDAAPNANIEIHWWWIDETNGYKITEFAQ